MKILTYLLASILFIVALYVPNYALAASAGCDDNDANTPCDILDRTCKTNSSAPGCSDRDQTFKDNSLYGPNGILTKATRLISILVGIASVIAIIIGGFKYVLSNGDSAGINSAKNTILYALIGLVLSVLAQAIVLFVLNGL